MVGEARGREEFRAALETAANAMVMVDVRGSIVLTNAEADRLFGYEPGELSGRVVEVLVPDRFKAAHPAHRTDFLKMPSGKVPMGTGRVYFGLRKDGVEFPADVGLSHVRLKEGSFVVASVIDVTARHASDQRLREAEEDLRRTVQDLEGFAYTVSHDLRSPLRAIQGYAHFAQERLKDTADPQSLDMLQRISASAVRLDRLIRDVLSYSAITRQAVELAPVDLDKVVDHVVGMYPILQSARLSVARPLGAVLAQESLMLQVVANLLVNAVKFVPAGRAAAIEVRTERSAPGKVSLVVADNGPGIPRVHWERIFQPFARLPSARGVAGSGIGLAIVKRAVERLGGTIRVESDPCTGTRFFIELTEAVHER